MRLGPRRPGNAPLPAAYRVRTERATTTTEPLRRDPVLSRIEALLWLADEPLSLRKMARALGVDAATAREAVNRLAAMLLADGSAFVIEEVAGGFQLLTRPEFYPWLVRLRRAAPDAHLSPALLETLAVIAYRQPVMRADIESIRGVHCGEAVRQLMERKLVQIVGRHDSLGRPVLYGTTRKFLQAFGLKDVADLPAVGT
ncbi:MAG: SMC-Scp complex subunit ScpB [Gemmataceae bacterium]|nr:SMC-Scp complex subunit ScpB [Gemmataceae bacterium]